MEYPICRRGHVKSPDNLTSNGKCKLCINIVIRNHHKNNPNGYTKRYVEYRKRYPEPLKKAAHKFRVKSVQNITRTYAAATLGIKIGQLTPELYELVRERLLMFRAIKELNQTIKEIGGIND